jgi:small-conductance mechanosensitive channel
MSLPSTRHIGTYLFVALLLTATLAQIFPALAQTAQQTKPAATSGDQQGQASSSASTETQTGAPDDIKQPVAKLTAAIEKAEKALQQLNDLEDELGSLRIDVEEILSDSVDTAEDLRPKLAAVRSQIEKLGPAPGKDAPAEAPAIAADRARLTALASELDGAVKTTELTWVRARQLIERITVIRHSIFTKNLLERLPSPLLPGLWRDFSNETPAVTRRVNYLSDDWWYWARGKELKLAGLLGGALLLFLVLRFIVARLTG